MITEIRLTNFKCFKEETAFPMSKINLLTGINGRGKSTLLQSLLLMRQTIEHNPNSREIIFNGSCVRLGAFEDVKNSDSSRDDNIQISFKLFNSYRNNTIHIHYVFAENSINERVATIKEISIVGEPSFYNREKKFTIFWDKNFMDSIDDDGRKSTSSYSEGLNSLLPLRQLRLKDTNHVYLHEFINFLKTHYIAADRIGSKDYYEKSNLGTCKK